MIPQTALAIPLFLLMSKIGLVDTPWAVILPSLVNPFGVYLMRVYAEQSVPDELLEAARIDGAGEGASSSDRAAHSLARRSSPCCCCPSSSTWNNYFLPLVMLESNRLFPLTVGLATWYQNASAGEGGQALFSLVLTGSLVSIVPIASCSWRCSASGRAALPPAASNSAEQKPELPRQEPAMLGVCYYPEHWPEHGWAEDAAAMRDRGITYVRIGEFAWSRIEPRARSFRLGLA